MPTDLRSSFDGQLDSPALSRPPKHPGITNLTVDVPDVTTRPRVSHQPQRWKTVEFLGYGVIFCITLPIMIWIPVSLSSTSHPNYPVYQRKLTPGWLFGRQVDDSDRQYRTFRDNVPTLTLLVGLFLATKTLYSYGMQRYLRRQREDNLYLIPFLLAFSTLLLIGLHGTSILKILAIISVNYCIGKSTGQSKLSPILSWVFNVAVLFANEWYSGYRFSAIHPSLDMLLFWLALAMGNQLQYQHASTHRFQHGLLLGMSSRRDCR